MAYAQIAYPQIQGINGHYSIHDIGCFLTAFCNLEAAFGNSVDPLTMNNYFVEHGVYIDIDDGVRDDLDWGFVQRYDVNTRVIQLGSGGWPQSNNAIVKFAYIHNGKTETHFSKVADYANQMILDSWDGQVKHISATWYGQPVAWAIYEHSAPHSSVPATPMITLPDLTSLYQTLLGRAPDQSGIDHYVGHYTAAFVEQDIKGSPEYATHQAQLAAAAQAAAYKPPSAPLPVPTDTTPYMILDDIPYFGSYQDAQNHTNPKGELKKESTYYRYKSLGGMDSLTDTPGTSQSIWINPADNVTPVKPQTPPSGWVSPRDDTAVPVAVVTQPTPPPVVVAQPAPVPAPASDDNTKVLASMRWFYEDRTPIIYKASANAVAVDLLYTNRSLPINQKKEYSVYGYFQKDGKTYLRVVPRPDVGTWATMYGVYTTDVATGAPSLDNEFLITNKIRYGFDKYAEVLIQTIEGIFRRGIKKQKEKV